MSAASRATVEDLATPSLDVGLRHPRRLVASLWLFAVLNYLYCDVVSLFDPAHLAELLSGSVGGLAMTRGFLLGAAVLMSVPMIGVLISRIAPHRLARWYCVIAGAAMTMVQLASLTIGGAPAPHYVYFSVIEIATTAVIVWIALTRWKADN